MARQLRNSVGMLRTFLRRAKAAIAACTSVDANADELLMIIHTPPTEQGGDGEPVRISPDDIIDESHPPPGEYQALFHDPSLGDHVEPDCPHCVGMECVIPVVDRDRTAGESSVARERAHAVAYDSLRAQLEFERDINTKLRDEISAAAREIRELTDALSQALADKIRLEKAIEEEREEQTGVKEAVTEALPTVLAWAQDLAEERPKRRKKPNQQLPQ